jgi:uncharacterized membrane protein
MEQITSGLVVAAAIGSGLVAGVLLAFSTFIMRALDRVPRAAGIAAMQQINITVITPGFMLPFLGTALVCAALLVAVLADWVHVRPPAIVGSLLYLVGTLGVTMLFNVPRNERLAGLGGGTPEAESYWSEYLRSWTHWNHLRTACSLLAAVALTLGRM